MKRLLFTLLILLVIPGLASFAQAGKYNEAPMLAALVKAGKLPPVEKRLPDNPLVVQPIDSIGTYGGNLNLTALEKSSWGDTTNLVRAHLIEMDHSTPNKLLPGLAEKWDMSTDGKTLTIVLRKGLKWSDGAPFNTDDLVFFWEDIQMNKELNPGGPFGQYQPGGKPMTVQKVDDLTIRYVFSVPYFSAVYYFAHYGDWFGSQQAVFQAKHVLKNYHIKYNPDADKLAKEKGFDHWYQYFNSLLVQNGNQVPEVPVMGPWMTVQMSTDGMSYTRNPYYYMVDTKGNQLPYIDTMRGTWRPDASSKMLSILGGEVDALVSGLSLEDYPVLKQNEAKGGYTTYLLSSGKPAIVDVLINQTYQVVQEGQTTGVEDKVMADLLRNVKFKQALSLAINRDEVNQLIFLGTGEPVQLTFDKSSSFYQDRWAKAYAQYDPAQANALLDAIGLKKGSDGFRLRPDGKALQLIYEIPAAIPGSVKSSELIKKYWQAVGLNVLIKVNDIGFVVNHLANSSYMVASFSQEVQSDIYSLLYGGQPWGVWVTNQMWWKWLTSGGTAGTEPPADLKSLYARDNTRQSIPWEEAKKIFIDEGDYQAANLDRLGVIGYAKEPAIFKKGLMNTDPTFGDIWEWDRIGGHCAYTWYWKK